MHSDKIKLRRSYLALQLYFAGDARRSVYVKNKKRRSKVKAILFFISCCFFAMCNNSYSQTIYPLKDPDTEL